MIYLIPAATAAMIAYVFWLAVFRLRRERVKSERELSRGKHAFRPKDRLRFLLGRSFGVSPERPEWEEPLVSRLTELPSRRPNDGIGAPAS